MYVVMLHDTSPDNEFGDPELFETMGGAVARMREWFKDEKEEVPSKAYNSHALKGRKDFRHKNLWAIWYKLGA